MVVYVENRAPEPPCFRLVKYYASPRLIFSPFSFARATLCGEVVSQEPPAAAAVLGPGGQCTPADDN